MLASAAMSRRRVGWLLAAAAFCTLWLSASRGTATIAEQRARLPPAAECDDEIVAGIWRSHKYNARFGDWSVFTLTIRRVPGSPDQLAGTISNRNWDGTAEDEEPPPCDRQRGNDWTVSMNARGTVHGNTIQFGGYGRWRLDQVHCRSGPYGYNLDNFTGEIDRQILEFQSVNNDGGRAVNVPNVFRRIRCPPRQTAQAPRVNPTPPAFYPELGGGGCGR